MVITEKVYTMALAVSLVLIVTIAGLECSPYNQDLYLKQPAFADKMCPLAQVDFQASDHSVVSCGRKCAGKPGCRSLVYLHGNKTCFGIKSDNPFGEASTLPGAVFYRSSSSQTTTTFSTTTSSTPTSANQAQPMVEGVADYQLTTSSNFSTSYTSRHARLSNIATCWAPAVQDTNQYIQVDFLSEKLTTAVETKGDPVYGDWVTTYQLLTSSDCSTFVPVQDGQGNDTIFAGNNDRNTAVRHTLAPPITCRCFRINPLSWYSYHIAVRFEVYGHTL